MSCGASLRSGRPSCGAEPPAEARFCFSCGHQLDTAAQGPELARPGEGDRQRLHQYIPRELLSKLEAARETGAIEGERRVVTMLFCDVKGSTAAAEELDPEDWHEIMNGAFEHLIAPVYRYEGTLARLMGDAILAFFGAPVAHEDDPVRAVRAGLDIVDSISPYRAEVKRSWDVDFDVRVGINTGLVVVGEVGSDLRMEYTAMGDAINLASRMEQTAEPGTIQITADTLRLVEPLFDFEDLGGIEVKGKPDPVQAYRVIGRKAHAGSLRGIKGLEAPLVGRDEEVAVLQRAMDELSKGTGGVVCLIADAGLGKSRQIAEARLIFTSTSRSVRWHETASLSYETNQPYGLFRHLVRDVCGIGESDTPEALSDAIGRVASTLDSGRRDQVEAVLGALFGLRTGTAAPVEGETFKGLLFSTMAYLWSEWASLTPTVVVFDDLHWADPASVDLVLHIMRMVERAPLLLVCATRQEQSAPGWKIVEAARSGPAERYSEIVLRPLSAHDSDHLVDELLTVADLPEGMRRQILDKSEGNPLFVEEVVRTLIDSGAVVRDETGARWSATDNGDADIDLPDNLQALLVARIDRLEEGVRRTVQMASVIGRSFYYRVLKRITELGDSLDPYLVRLQNAELILETGRSPEREYAFRHSLTQEAAYNTILLRRRREFHRSVGEAMEELFPDRYEELAQRLAHHFAEARVADKALRYYTLAGDAAMRLYANAEAAGHYGEALQLALRQNGSGETLAHIYRSRGRAMELSDQFEDAIDNYAEMESLAHERGDSALELAALTARASVHATQSPKFDPIKAKADSDRAFTLARELKDRESESKILWNLMMVNMHGLSNPEQAVAYGEKSLAIARELGLREQIAYTLSDLGWAYGGVSKLDLGGSTLDEARELWKELGNLPMLSNNLSVSSLLAFLRAEYEVPIANSVEALEISRSIDNIWGQWSAASSPCFTYMELGELGKSIESSKLADSLSQQGGLVLQRSFGYGILAWAYASAGSFDKGRPYYNQASQSDMAGAPAPLRSWSLALLGMFEVAAGDLQSAEESISEAHTGIDLNDFTYPASAFVLLARGQLAVAQGDWDRANIESDEMIEVLTGAGARTFLPDGLYFKGRALQAKGHPTEARESLVQASDLAEQISARRIHWRILGSLSDAEAAAGRSAEAERYRSMALDIVRYIAERTGSDELRASFLAQPDVRPILKDSDLARS